MTNKKYWILLAEVYQLILAVEGNEELTKRLLAKALMEGKLKARSRRAYIGNSSSPVEIEFPTDRIYVENNAQHNFNWGESRALLGKWFERTSKDGPTFSQPRRELFRIEVTRDSLLAEFPDISRPVEPAVASAISRQRGPHPAKRERVMEEMRRLPRHELLALKEEAMAATFKAGRTTCREARNEVLSEFVDD